MTSQKLNGIPAIKIMAANHFGHDKLTFDERISWFDMHESLMIQGEDITVLPGAEKPILMAKALAAYVDAKAGVPTGYLCELDATASGIQIMAALSGCIATAMEVNMLKPNQRRDLYTTVAEQMSIIIKKPVDRKKVKKPVMTHYYNSVETPKAYMNQDELNAFYQVLDSNFEGAEEVMQMINECWNPNALFHQWTLPDGHVARCKTMTYKHGLGHIDKYDIDLDYVYWVNEGNHNYRSLAPNVIHSIDGYVAREMVRRAKKLGYELVHIHDCFMFHPNYMDETTELYRDIMAEIASSNLLADILTEITGTPVAIQKTTNMLPASIKSSTYMLS